MLINYRITIYSYNKNHHIGKDHKHQYLIYRCTDSIVIFILKYYYPLNVNIYRDNRWSYSINYYLSMMIPFGK
jgi:hypothetical protein